MNSSVASLSTRAQPSGPQPRQPYRLISAFNIQPGAGDLIATCTVKVGGILIRGVRVRRGRRGSVFVNWPSVSVDGQWVPLVEITSQALLDTVKQVVLTAVFEATR